MSKRLVVVVSDPADLPELPPDRLVTADRYLGGGEIVQRGAAVVNLCRSYRYRTKGYYVSLVADARGQRVLPTVETIEGLTEPYGLFRILGEAGVPTVEVVRMRQRRRALPSTVTAEADSIGPEAHPSLLHVSAEEPLEMRPARDAEAVEAFAFFGRCSDARFRAAAQAIYREWPTPVLRIQLVQEEEEEWKVAYAAAVPVQQLTAEDRSALALALQDERSVLRRATPTPREVKRASLAVLYDETDPFSPSTPETIDRLVRLASRMNVHVHRLGLDEIDRLGEYDALFIRTLTGVREPSFQFALRAEMLDMPVIDDPQSIIRCSNKVFLEELLRREGIATPRTLVITSQTPRSDIEALGYPVVVKQPDGSFSSAVHKCADRAEYERVTGEMLRRSPLLIAQEFLPTDFDWRITVLEGKVLFAARYFMARGHWQIRSADPGGERYGRVEAVRRDAAPRPVVELALRAAALIGNGLYGVDIKETSGGPAVIEVNDNPNLDIGYDDAADGNVVYEDLLEYFLRRVEEAPAPVDEVDPRPPPKASPARTATKRQYRPFEVAGIELEYPVVDRDLNAVSLVEDAFRAMTGRPTSDVDLGRVAFSNEIADHVFEVKIPEPTRRLRDAEEALVDGVLRFSGLLRERFGARLLPTGMHPWLKPRKARLWTRSNARVYQTYARLFDVHTHGWLNVHASHVNLPVGSDEEAVAMYNASALLIPYLPALAASSPMYDGELQEAADNRLSWILEHQARIPESCGRIVPEYVESLADYRKRILGGMYHALDQIPGSAGIRHEFFNARGAVLKYSRRAMEIRVLDTQECVKLDIAIAVFVRATLRHLTRRVLAGRMALPDHDVLVDDFRATVQAGAEAKVRAPHLGQEGERLGDGSRSVRSVLRHFLAHARKEVRREDADYLDLVDALIESGTLSERIRSHLMLYVDDEEGFTEAARRVYIELADCLESNEPWWGRGL